MLFSTLMLRLQLSKLLNTFLFFLRYPYVRSDFILGLKHMKLPRVFRGGKNIRLIVKASTLNSSDPNLIIEPGVWFNSNVELNTFSDSKIHIKTGTSLQDNCKIIGNVTIERDVIFAPNVYISSGTHQYSLRPHLTIREQDRIAASGAVQKSVHVEEDCWLGINVFVKAGTYIGRGAVIGANACVLRDVKPYEIVVGAHKCVSPRLLFSPPNHVNAANENHRPYFYRGFAANGLILGPNALLVVSAELSTAKTLIIKGENLGAIKSIRDQSGRPATFNANKSDEILVAWGEHSEAVPPIPQILLPYLCISITVDPFANVVISNLQKGL